MKAGIYARVSTHDQQTLNMQIDAMKKYAKVRDWQIETEIAEIGSGAKDSRPQREELLNQAKRRQIDVIIVWKLDRWSRSVNDLFHTLNELNVFEHTQNGYDKKTIATDIKALVEYLGETQAIIIGHDMGGKAAYVMAHLYPHFISKLILVDCTIPGTENSDALHGGAWHYGFHMAPEIPEMLTKGREKEYIRAQIKVWLFNKDAIDEDTIDEYVKHYAKDGGMTAGFNYYRALKEDAALVETFHNQKLMMPVLTITGLHSVGDKLQKALENEATSLKSIIVADSGHFVPEEAPEIFNSSVLKFLESANN